MRTSRRASSTRGPRATPPSSARSWARPPASASPPPRSPAAAGAGPTPPRGVPDVIARRLTFLSDEANRVLVLASVLGREFGLDTLAAVAGITPDATLDVLDEAMSVRVVSSVGARLRFAHVL